MALSFSPPKIVTSGLIFYLDAPNKKSYSGSGSTWTDLITDVNIDLINGPTFTTNNLGTFILDGVDDYLANGVYPNPSKGNDIFNFEGTEPFSISFWVKIFSVAGTQRNIISTSRTGTSAGWRVVVRNQRIYFYVIGADSFAATYSDVFINYSEWINVATTYDGSELGTGMNTYHNGVNVNNTIFQNVVSGSTFDVSQPLVIGAFNNPVGSAPLDAELSNIKVYNKELTQSEVLQNYNALKYRFI
jgi:hypothetical protein